MQAQFSRRQPEIWGALQAYDVNCANYNTGGWKTAFAYIKSYPQTPSVAALRAAQLSELTSYYTTTLQRDWRNCVANYTAHSNAVACKGS